MKITPSIQKVHGNIEYKTESSDLYKVFRIQGHFDCILLYNCIISHMLCVVALKVQTTYTTGTEVVVTGFVLFLLEFSLNGYLSCTDHFKDEI